MFLESGQLFAKLRQLFVLQEFVLDHLPQLLNVLRDVLRVDDGHALGLRTGANQVRRTRQDQRTDDSRAMEQPGRKASYRHQRTSLIVKSMNAASANLAEAWAS